MAGMLARLLPRLGQALPLALWAAVLLRSSRDGRLDLLLRAAFHPLVWIAGLLLLGLALAQLLCRPDPAGPLPPRRALATGVIALALLLLPPNPSFADLASQRPVDETADTELSFVLPPAQRSLTDWVRLLRSQPDPRLFDGDPVRISGFVLPIPGEPAQLARLLVRCCLADATPVGLPVRWPADRPAPRADQWLAIEGTMAVGADGLVVVPERIRPIPRPARPLEP
jgi:uncharacterized repeat protein (TIGR03943 family)